MILDTRTTFADGVALAGAADVRNIGDVIDLGEEPRDVGQGQPLYLYINIDTAPTGADTVEFHLVSDSTDTPADAGTSTEHLTTGAIAIADLPAGRQFIFALPMGATYERYLGLQATNVGASALADLVVSAGLTLDPRGWRAYPEGAN